MSAVALVLMILATVAFVLAGLAAPRTRDIGAIALGLALLTVGLIFEFATHAHTVHF